MHRDGTVPSRKKHRDGTVEKRTGNFSINLYITDFILWQVDYKFLFKHTKKALKKIGKVVFCTMATARL